MLSRFHTGMVITSDAKVTYTGHYDTTGLHAMAVKAMKNKNRKCTDGPITVEIVKVEPIIDAQPLTGGQ